MAISHIPRSVGHNFTPEYQISAIPYVKSGVINTYDNGSPAQYDGDGDNIWTVELPKISQWLQFKAGANAVTVYFSKNDAKAEVDGITIAANTTTSIMRIRCANLYFNNTNQGHSLEIRSGLTSINREEFTNVIETFLGDS